jgi:hypothetical protein
VPEGRNDVGGAHVPEGRNEKQLCSKSPNFWGAHEGRGGGGEGREIEKKRERTNLLQRRRVDETMGAVILKEPHLEDGT